MFEFLQQNKKEYISCEWLEYGMACMDDGLNNCCFFPNPLQSSGPLSKVKNGQYDFKEFFKIKKQMRKNFSKGNISENCKGCPNLNLNNWRKENKLKQLIISSYTKCNADCIYCFTHRSKKFYNSRSNIPIADFIKKCINKKVIDKDTFITFGGGEPTINEEFEIILKMIIQIPEIKMKIYSSGIKYSEAIEQALQLENVELVISPDSGERELYKKIKNVDKFDNVWTNLKQYHTHCHVKTNVIVKYILIENINDKKEDFIKFIDKVLETQINTVKYEIDYNYFSRINKNRNKIKEIFEKIKFMEEYSKKFGLIHRLAGNMSCLVEQNREIYKEVYNI